MRCSNNTDPLNTVPISALALYSLSCFHYYLSLSLSFRALFFFNAFLLYPLTILLILKTSIIFINCYTYWYLSTWNNCFPFVFCCPIISKSLWPTNISSRHTSTLKSPYYWMAAASFSPSNTSCKISP